MSRRFEYSTLTGSHVETQNKRPSYSKAETTIKKTEGFVVTRLSKLRKPGERGLGDTIERLIAKFGGNKFKQITARIGINCGCEDRQKYLNERYPYQTE